MRHTALAAVAAFVVAVERPHPVRVAIDGRTASGKTTIADELALELKRIGRATIRTSIDGFHRPKRDRYARGRHSPEGYYFDARDLDAIRRLLLEPLGPGGTLTYRTASFDLATDLPIMAPTHRADRADILIVDGTFLQRPELRDAWEVAVFVDVDAATAAQRGASRDAVQLDDRFQESCHMGGIHLSFQAPIYAVRGFATKDLAIWRRGGGRLNCRSEKRIWRS
jgi:uridine kinase